MTVLGFDPGRGHDITSLVVVTADGTRAMVELGRAATRVDAVMRAFARAHERPRWLALWADYNAHGRTRPDGRLRRSGHRHRGTAAWARRHG